jgi:hypothetical protein
MEQPLWLLGLALIVPVVWTGLAWFPATMSRARAWSAVVLRSVLIALIVLILGGASAVHRSDRLATIALVDVSDSVRQYAEVGVDGAGRPMPPLEGLRAWIERAVNDPARRPDDLFGALVFDGESIAIVTPRPLGGGRAGGAGFLARLPDVGGDEHRERDAAGVGDVPAGCGAAAGARQRRAGD